MNAGPAKAKRKLVLCGTDVIEQIPVPLVSQPIGVITKAFETILFGKSSLGSVGLIDINLLLLRSFVGKIKSKAPSDLGDRTRTNGRHELVTSADLRVLRKYSYIRCAYAIAAMNESLQQAQSRLLSFIAVDVFLRDNRSSCLKFAARIRIE